MFLCDYIGSRGYCLNCLDILFQPIISFCIDLSLKFCIKGLITLLQGFAVVLFFMSGYADHKEHAILIQSMLISIWRGMFVMIGSVVRKRWNMHVKNSQSQKIKLLDTAREGKRFQNKHHKQLSKLRKLMCYHLLTVNGKTFPLWGLNQVLSWKNSHSPIHNRQFAH